MWNWTKKGSDTSIRQGTCLNADLAQKAPKSFIVGRQRIVISGRSLFTTGFIYILIIFFFFAFHSYVTVAALKHSPPFHCRALLN